MSGRLHTKSKRTKIAEAEAERQRKKKLHQERLELKASLLEKEFERSLSQEKFEGSPAYQAGEIKLQAIYNEICASNKEKNKHINAIDEFLSSMVREEKNFDKRMSFQHPAGLQKILSDSKNLINKSVHPSYFPVQYRPLPETLEGRFAELTEKYEMLQRCLEEEDSHYDGLIHKYKEMEADKMLIASKLHEFKKLSVHAEKRFSDLRAVEHLAKIRRMRTQNTLEECKETISLAEKKEREYLEALYQTTAAEREKFEEEKNKMSELLIKIEDEKRLNELYDHRLETLEKHAEEMAMKKSDGNLVRSYIQVLEKIEKEYLDDDRGNKRNSQTSIPDSEIEGENKATPAAANRHSLGISKVVSRFSVRNQLGGLPSLGKRSMTMNYENGPSDEKSIPKINQRFRSLRNFFTAHKEGPETLADRVIQKFTQLAFGEISLRTSYEDLMNQKITIQNEYEFCMKILTKLKQENQEKQDKQAAMDKKPEAVKTDPASPGLPAMKKKMMKLVHTSHSDIKPAWRRMHSENLTRHNTRDSPMGRSLMLFKSHECDLSLSPGIRNKTLSAVIANSSEPMQQDTESTHTKISDLNENIVEKSMEAEESAVYDGSEKIRLEENHNDLLDYIRQRHVKLQSFIVRSYLDLTEVLYRYLMLMRGVCKHSNEPLPQEIESIYNVIFTYLRDLRGQKKLIRLPRSPADSPGNNDSKVFFDSVVTDTLASFSNESVHDEISTPHFGSFGLNINEVKSMYPNYFGQSSDKAAEFFSAIKSNVVINTFVSLEDVDSFFQKNAPTAKTKGGVGLTLEHAPTLEEIGTNNMLQRFKNLFQYYTDLVTKLTTTVEELGRKFNVPKTQAILTTEQSIDDHFHMRSSTEYLKARKPFDLGEFNRRSQEKRVRELTKNLDLSSREKTGFGDVSKLEETVVEAITFNAAENEVLENKDLKSRLANLSTKVMQKKRGYFYNKLQYEFQSKAQREQEEFMKVVIENQKKQNIKQTEEGYFQHEREQQRLKAAELREKLAQGSFLTDDKASTEPQEERGFSAQPAYDKAQMKEHSHALSQIRFLESHIGPDLRPKTTMGATKSSVIHFPLKPEIQHWDVPTKPTTANSNVSRKARSFINYSKSPSTDKLKVTEFASSTATPNTQKKSRPPRKDRFISTGIDTNPEDFGVSRFMISPSYTKHGKSASQETLQDRRTRKKTLSISTQYEGSTEAVNSSYSQTMKNKTNDFKIRKMKEPKKLAKRRNLSQINFTTDFGDGSASKSLFDVLYRGLYTRDSYPDMSYNRIGLF